MNTYLGPGPIFKLAFTFCTAVLLPASLIFQIDGIHEKSQFLGWSPCPVVWLSLPVGAIAFRMVNHPPKPLHYTELSLTCFLSLHRLRVQVDANPASQIRDRERQKHEGCLKPGADVVKAQIAVSLFQLVHSVRCSPLCLLP